ncbi:MAG: response regulator [Proteobacteria bacterium]|nr:response regulator [Pseudomonadota bacterium]
MPRFAAPSTLVVDDETGIRILFKKFLVQKGHNVSVAATKAEALDLLSKKEFDLLLLDKNLPDGSGLEIVAKVRKLEHCSEIIIITGFSDIESTIESIKYKVYRYLCKPIDLDLLSVEIAGALETRALRHGLFRRTEELEVFNTELARSERRFRELAELLPGILVETDENGTLTFVNRSSLTITGYDRSEFYQRFTDGTLVIPEDEERLKEDIGKVYQWEEIVSNEYHLQRKNGTSMPVILRASPVIQDGQLAGLRAILFDITEHKKAEIALREKEAQLQLAQKMEAIGTLAGGVAHDFNNMLGAIKGYCDVVLHDLHEADPIRADIEGIVEAADRAAELTYQLLAFGRKQILKSQVLNLNDVIRDIERMLARLIRENIELKVKLNPDLKHVYADPGQIEQVIMNFVVNARDAMPKGGRLVIETANIMAEEQDTLGLDDNMPEDQVMLAVTDNGIGMDDETISRIFEPFFTTKEQRRGTGLGLATAYGIIKQSGGNIRVNSKPGKGSRFEIVFPRVDEALAKADSLVPNAEFLSGGETILVVEDEEMLLELVGRMLRMYGYNIIEASHGEDALLRCKQHDSPIELLLTDVVMPRMSGPELAKQLETLYPEMAVLYMSGYSDATLVGQVMSSNADCFITKPFSAQRLASKVRDVLAIQNT